jgi:hypothetical protein
MRYRLMATYRGVAYEAGVGPTDKDITLFAACPPPEDLGFQPATGHWRKAVSRAEVDAVWESRPSGVFGGEPCLVLDDLGEHLHISYLGHDLARAGQLGYSEVEPGVFELLATREDVIDVTEDRVDHALLPRQEGWPGSVTGGAANSHRPVTAPDPAITYPEPAPDPATTDPGPAPDPAITDPRPAPEAAITDPRPAPESAITDPGPAPDPAITYPEPAPQAAITRPGPAPDLAITDPGPAPEAAITDPGPDAGLGRRHRRAAHRPPRAQTRQVFAELAGLAALPQDSYAVDEAVDGAICLVSTDTGFEVFSAADGVKREARLFNDEEAAYFYLFGLLAAEAVRDGRLMPPGTSSAP